MKSTVLPDSMLRCLSPEDRRKLGQKTASEVLEAGEAKSEKELQKQIVGLLRLKGIQVNVSRMDKRKTDAVGWPDLTFAISLVPDPPGVYFSCACAWEVKLPQGKLTPGQEQMRVKLTTFPNDWRYRVIRSVDDALRELREMGVG